ncbi:MAG: aldose 1-epimerase [Chitinophagaceae bacterium]|nr:aldose 1-epimerase [Chitinophagaceae bacterium]
MHFTIVIDDSGLHPVITIAEAEQKAQVEIYTFGALLNKFCKQHNGENFNVIDGFESVHNAKQHITVAFKSARLSPFVCRIKNAKYHFGEADHKLTKFSLSDSAIHGLLFDQVFSIIDTIVTDEYAKVILQYVYENQNEGFPFLYRCEVEYCLKKDCTLCIKTTITNIDDQLVPVADGWHPYFALGDKIDVCQLEFQSKEKLEFNEALIPTGAKTPYQEFGSLKKLGSTWLDNCFTVNFAECQPMVVFRNPIRKIQVEIHPSEQYPYLQIFTPPHRNSIAIENLSAAPDALNNFMGLQVLEPQERISFSTKFIIKSL